MLISWRLLSYAFCIGIGIATAYSHPEIYRIQIGLQTYVVPLVPIANNTLKIAYIDLKDNPVLIEALATEIAKYIKAHRKQIDVLVTPEANTMALAYAVHQKTGIDYIILSKKERPNLGNKALSVNVKSITTDTVQTLWLSEENIKKIANRKVLILDDTISSGGTINAIKTLIQKANGIMVLPPLVGFYEGSKRDDVTAISPTVLPLTPVTHSEDGL